MTAPTVTVLLPVFNGEKYLEQAVESVVSQTFGDFHLICINDGSTDRSLEILESFNDKRLQIISKENGGIISALNLGIGISKGRYIARMDSDDICEPDRFEKQVSFLDQNPQIGIVGSFLSVIDENDHLIDKWFIPSSPGWVKRRLALFPSVYHPTVMLRKRVFDELGGYPVIPHVEDYALWLKASEGFQLANIPLPLLRYRLHGKSVSSRFSNTQIKNHNLVRRKYWAKRPLESTTFSKARKEIESIFKQENICLPKPDGTNRLKSQFVSDCIFEANLASGAGRKDIWRGRLIELSIVDNKAKWKWALILSKLFGYKNTWSFLKRFNSNIFKESTELWQWR